MSAHLPSQWKQFGAYTNLIGRHATSLPKLKQEMLSRKLPSMYDDCSKIRSDLLTSTLHDILPERMSASQAQTKMPQPYHLVYFHPPTRLSALFPDGTDPIHSPGLPFTRRLWAAGDITFNDDLHFRDDAHFRCNEAIKDVEIKGTTGDEKVFVTIERRINYLAKSTTSSEIGESPDPIIENRKLVFMRELPPPPRLDSPILVAAAAAAARNPLKHPHEPLAKHTLTPSPALLFRFSALTFNAHAIHLSKPYCQEIYGHRNLLVHGPLTLVLMLQFLTRHLLEPDEKSSNNNNNNKDHVITFVAYRNLAPLYAEEEMTLCLRQKDEHLWETWIEGPDGGLAVRASVRTAEDMPRCRERPRTGPKGP
ncbi:MAG: hypothetical protein L6R40_002844 [Gallowayella cf. fulva]|nr:MAG: hypothetical protein L6R40_002844 [Xanthomendoza cf. fulva]